ncbi:hypothetical protein CWE09_09560 [Aliidiomarina minuta]|uniref:Uncharacterized protein n=1 Tax=Aliidiomarina minuta TaxID=880057 RepID=A0A432WAA7_9GAMM|nr:hypothetical protein [Aliidiomarina minuta]RUO26916.1 hypothetical protein CWE09_09560 [Aliidiomarina minuta]
MSLFARHWAFWLLSVAGFTLVLLTLMLYPLPGLGDKGVLLALMLLSWLAYQYLNQVRRMRRHALLNHVLNEKSSLRELLWDSWLSKIGLGISSLVVALVALILSARLQPVEWAVLFASIPAFLLCYQLAYRLLRKQVAPAYHSAMSLRFAFWANIILIALVMSLVQFFWLEVADTRHLNLYEVALSSYQVANAEAAVPATGLLLGLNAAINDSVWHIMQLASGELALGWKLLIWLTFVLLNSIKLGAIWIILLGVVAFFQRRRDKALGSAFSKTYALTLVVLIILYVAMTRINVASFWQQKDPQWAQSSQPCNEQRSLHEQQMLATHANNHLTEQQAQLNLQVEKQLEMLLDSVFDSAEQGVDNFLDWNFSLRGQYQQLAYLGAGMASSVSVESFISAKLEQHVAQQLETGVLGMEDELSTFISKQMAGFYGQHQRFLQQLTANASCFDASSVAFAVDDYMAKSLVGIGSAAGVAGALTLRSGGRAGSQALGRVISRRMAARVAVHSSVRAGSRAAATSGGAGAGVVCGPAAPACALGFGVATWLAIDLAVNAVDEALNRERMKNELMELLEEQRQALELEIRAEYQQYVEFLFMQLEEFQQRRFNIYRDALS